MKPWQTRALGQGCTPLPENPGERPWLRSTVYPTRRSGLRPGSIAHSEGSTTVQGSNPANNSIANPAAANEGRNQSCRFWEESELRRMIEMRSGGAEWSAIVRAFPDRTLEALKQTYRKRRHGMEQKLAEKNSIPEDKDNS
ncbi:hypothetical protein FBEOM_5561 [Fusarium beomiforme]|uniref:Myb-like domain-containing protein n=1 Tax=Fusarium beomiforme TaxID=44412 RepID=A0A9P5AL89_9HYPO|nr:hypothetical protein FBEOM_5561 [Fusarium beomiforme]